MNLFSLETSQLVLALAFAVAMVGLVAPSPRGPRSLFLTALR